MAGFSGAIKLADMNDYLAPSQACIAPLLRPPKAGGSDAAAGAQPEQAKANSGTRVRVEMELGSSSDASDLRFPGLQATGGAASTVAPAVGGGGHFDQIRSDPLKKTATVSLNDCLACSGCVTSAETVLITQQSTQEMISVLEANAAIRAAAAAGSVAAMSDDEDAVQRTVVERD